MPPEQEQELRSWIDEGVRRTFRALPQRSDGPWRTLLLGVFATVLTGVMGYAALAILDTGREVAVLASEQATDRQRIEAIDAKLDTLVAAVHQLVGAQAQANKPRRP